MHHLLSSFGTIVEDKGALGAIIGYSIIDSLRRITELPCEEKPRRQREMGAIYAGLEDALSNSFDDPRQVLNVLRQENDRFLDKFLSATPPAAVPSILLKAIIVRSVMNKATYGDRIGRMGQMLYRNIMERPMVHGADNIVMRDYDAVRKHFLG